MCVLGLPENPQILAFSLMMKPWTLPPPIYCCWSDYSRGHSWHEEPSTQISSSLYSYIVQIFFWRTGRNLTYTKCFFLLNTELTKYLKCHLCILTNFPPHKFLVLSQNSCLAILTITRETESAQMATPSNRRVCWELWIYSYPWHKVMSYLFYSSCRFILPWLCRRYFYFNVFYKRAYTPLPLSSVSFPSPLNTLRKSLWFLVAVSQHSHHSHLGLFVFETESNSIASVLPWERDGTLPIIILSLCQSPVTLESRWN